MLTMDEIIRIAEESGAVVRNADSPEEAGVFIVGEDGSSQRVTKEMLKNMLPGMKE